MKNLKIIFIVLAALFLNGCDDPIPRYSSTNKDPSLPPEVIQPPRPEPAPEAPKPKTFTDFTVPEGWEKDPYQRGSIITKVGNKNVRLDWFPVQDVQNREELKDFMEEIHQAAVNDCRNMENCPFQPYKPNISYKGVHFMGLIYQDYFFNQLTSDVFFESNLGRFHAVTLNDDYLNHLEALHTLATTLVKRPIEEAPSTQEREEHFYP